ncbi:MAG TPA: preprotein translocase subunit SecE [bacterium]|nr:preprotein translocase subunit SecE [bacterium]HPN32824.1 preprotein translocase subunit SecE [bacterium]
MELKIKENWNLLKDFLKEVWFEANPKNGNVVWPSKKEIGATTLAVVVTIAIISVYVGVLDYIFALIIKLIYKVI